MFLRYTTGNRLTVATLCLSLEIFSNACTRAHNVSYLCSLHRIRLLISTLPIPIRMPTNYLKTHLFFLCSTTHMDYWWPSLRQLRVPSRCRTDPLYSSHSLLHRHFTSYLLGTFQLFAMILPTLILQKRIFAFMKKKFPPSFKPFGLVLVWATRVVKSQ